MLAPIAPAPATTIRAIVSSSARSSGVSVRKRCAHVLIGSQRPGGARQIFSAAWNGKRSQHRAHLVRRRPKRSRTSPATSSGKAAASPETAPAAPRSRPWRIERLGPDEDVEPLDQERLDRRRTAVRDLEAARFGASSRNRSIALSGIE